MTAVSIASEWLNLGLIVWNIGLTAALWMRKPGIEAAAAVRGLETAQGQRHDALAHRVVTLEERVRHMPASEDLARVEGAVQALDERAKGLTEAVTTIRASVARIENFLLHTK